MLAEQRIHMNVTQEMVSEIQQSQGNEVLWWCKLDREGLIGQATVSARGHEEAVPALFPHMTKGDVIIHNHPSGELRPSNADLAVATQLGNQGIGFYIVDNNVSRVYVVSEPIITEFQGPLEPEDVAAYLEPGGPLEELLKGYEPREPQINLLKMLVRGFNENLIMAAEAGTGVGKSLAYLIPAFLWAEKNKERVVISTGTINLQQQIIEKDIPLVKKMLNSQVKAVLVKGRGNYLCLKRLQEALHEDSLFRDSNDDLSLIKEWSTQSKGGSRTDLSFQINPATWGRVNSEADLCTGIRCPHYEKCFVMMARKEAASAGILVVNHHLLFADLSLRLQSFGFESFAVLPPFQRVIFDEAHNMEKAATSFFSKSYSRYAMVRNLNRIYRTKGNKESGLLRIWERRAGMNDQANQIPGAIQEILKASDELEGLTMDFNPFKGSMALREQREESLRFGIMEPMLKLQNQLLRLIHLMQDTLKEMPEGQEEEDYIQDWKMQISRLDGFAQFFETYRNFKDKIDEIFWIEKKSGREGKEYLHYYITPLDIAPMMKEALYEPFASVLCTSATLSVNRNFKYWMDRTGISLVEEQRKEKAIFDSPFNYRDRVMLAVPRDVPSPTEREEWLNYCLPFIEECICISQGKALILFTSYELLMLVYQQLQGPLEAQGISLFRQGELDRHRLLTQFKENLSSVLLATDSFWEGVDIPGEALQMVIITRLPFRVPSDPVIKARMDALELKGGNSFRDMSLPDAITRFKQGFGRLMRSHSDGGVVLVLDGRILRKSYGPAFIQSLPETRRNHGSKESLIIDMENFFYAKK